MKIVISQAMKGKSKEEIEARRAALVKDLEAQGHKVVNTLYSDYNACGNIPLQCLSRTIGQIAVVDKVYFLGEDWNSSRGCIVENMICNLYGIPFEIVK
ncbi:hypothetical protein AGMMS49592_5620 [Endomicrobiia bacterium]|nr:hypothetical protein AGMMS49592_5620 [Endomicrobiia bacterium]